MDQDRRPATQPLPQDDPPRAHRADPAAGLRLIKVWRIDVDESRTLVWQTHLHTCLPEYLAKIRFDEGCLLVHLIHMPEWPIAFTLGQKIEISITEND